MNYSRHLESASDSIQKADVYEYQPIPFTKKMKRWFRMADIFAYPVTLKYKGERRFNTNFGAMTSIIIFVIMIVLTLVQVHKMIARKQITFQESFQLADPTSFLLGYDEGFVFGYRIFNRVNDATYTFNHTGYLNVSVEQVTTQYDQYNNETSTTKYIEMRNCKKSDYYKSDISDQLIKRVKIDTFACPKNRKYMVRGDQLDLNHTQIKVQIKRCNSKLTPGKCRSEEEINELVNKLQVQFLFTNSNFDQRDMLDPVKTYFDMRLSEGMMSNFQRRYDIYIQNTTATLHDDYLLIKSPVQLRFYQVRQIEKYMSQTQLEKDNLMEFHMLASRQAVVYERKIFSMVDIFAQIGGIKTTLMLAGLGFCCAFQQTLLQASLIRKLFHFPARFDSERKDLKKKKNKLMNKGGLKRDRSGSVIQDHKEYLESQNNMLTPNEIAEAIQRDKKLGIQEIKDEINQVTGRSYVADFKLKTLGILKGMVCCLIFRKWPSLRQTPSKRQILFYQKGEDRINCELDVLNILKSIRKIKYLMKILLDKDQRRLLQLKTTEFISSDIEEFDPCDYKKHLLKNKLVNLYVDNLRKKKLKRSDIKLLEITGFKKVIDLLNKQRAVDRVQSEWADETSSSHTSNNPYKSGDKKVKGSINRDENDDEGVPGSAQNRDWKLNISASPKRVYSAGIVNAPQGKGLINQGFFPTSQFKRKVSNAEDFNPQSSMHDINRTLDSIVENETQSRRDQRGETFSNSRKDRMASTLMNEMLEDEEPSSPDMVNSLRKKSLRTNTIKHHRSIRGQGQDLLLAEQETPYLPPQLKEELLADSHFKQVERQLFDEDDQGFRFQDGGVDRNSDDDNQYRGNKVGAKNKHEINKESAKKNQQHSSKQQEDLTRSQVQELPGSGGNRLNMSAITGKNTGQSMMIVGKDESDGGGSLKQGLIPKIHKPAKKYQNPSRK